MQKGDSLVSIAQRQLGDAKKVDQLIAINKEENPSLKSSTSLIEIGWKLYIPPKELINLTGNLTASDGKIIEKNTSVWHILLWEGSIPQAYNIDQSTIFLDEKDFNIGDCVRIIESGIYQSDGRYKIIERAFKHQE